MKDIICDNNKKKFINPLSWGNDNESKAIRHYRDIENMEIQPAGLFNDKTHWFLGATPDALVGEDGILEIKCPYSTRHMTMRETIALKQKSSDRITIY